MKKPALLIVLFLFPFMAAYSNSFIPIPISGFNEDVVAHDKPADQTTSVTFDDYNRVFYVVGFPHVNADYGVPKDGIIISEANPEITYQLADYEGNNCLHLRVGATIEGTLELNNPGWFEKISFLATSGQGSSIVEVTLNYGDGSTQSSGPFTIPDWFGGTDYAIKGLDRVDRRNDTPDGNSTDPRLYDFIIPNVDPEKALVSIHFEKTSTGSGRAGIFAISGVESPPPPVPLSPIVFVIFSVMAMLFVFYRSRLW